MKQFIPSFRKPSFLSEQGSQRLTGESTDHGQEGTALPPPPSTIAQHVIYRAPTALRFGRIAKDLGLLTASQVDTLLAAQSQSGGRIGEIAIETGVLTEGQVAEILSAQSVQISVDARHLASPAFLTWLEDIKRHGALPDVTPVSAEDLEALRQQGAGGLVIAADLKTLIDARQIFTDAAALGVSDVYILVRPNHAEVQVRLKGDYRLAKNYTMRHEEGEALVRSIYTGLATVKQATYNERLFQDAQINGVTALPGTGLSSIRIIRGPMYPVEAKCSFMAARLQYLEDDKTIKVAARSMELVQPAAPPGIFQIPGFTARQLELCEILVRLPMGVVIVTGPTGSGKTTALYNLMKHQARLFPEARQITIENPPEYPQPWAVTLAAEDNFQQMVKYSLRMDPDIILIGELRAADEAVAAMQAAMTGHFVWTTLHVTDAYKSITRLEMLDGDRLSRDTTCDHELIVGMISLRIVPVLCPDCSVPLISAPDALPDYLVRNLKTWATAETLANVRLRGCGCKTCNGQRVIDRQAVAEIVLTDEQFMDDFRRQGILVARRNHRAKEDADKSMLENVMDLVLAGTVDPLDAHRNVHKIEPKEVNQ